MQMTTDQTSIFVLDSPLVIVLDTSLAEVLDRAVKTLQDAVGEVATLADSVLPSNRDAGGESDNVPGPNLGDLVSCVLADYLRPGLERLEALLPLTNPGADAR